MNAGWERSSANIKELNVSFIKSKSVNRKEKLLPNIEHLNQSPEEQSYWWVNHKQSHKYEITNGLLWSPQRKSNGSASHFYDNMRKAKPGDFILSMANANIGAIGVIQQFAAPAPIPISYNTENNIWGKIGWLLPVSWAQLSQPIKVKDHINLIREYLPQKYSPIQIKSGNGNQGAYLCSISKKLFQSMIDLSKETIDDLSVEHPAMPLEKFDDQLANHDTSFENFSDTERQQISKARKGQGIFKENVRKRMTSCPVTGVNDIKFLIASHIKPWRVCDTANDRLSGDNGFISFSDEYTVLQSKFINQITIKQLGLRGKFETTKLKLNNEQKAFMEYHKEFIFKK